MKQYRLYEDKRPRKLHVITSQKIDKRIDDIYTYNQDNIVAVRAWLEYIEDLEDYISNPAIAFDYTHRYVHFPNGAIHLMELGYDVSFIVKSDNTNGQLFVYIFDINLNYENFGLTDPSNITDHKIHNIMSKKTKIRLTETQLHRVIRQCLSETKNTARKDIFTLDVFNETQDSGIDDMQHAAQIYYSYDEAYDAAVECAEAYSDDPNEIIVYILAGEYELPSGDIYGEPVAVEYVSNHQSMKEAIRRAIRKVLR